MRLLSALVLAAFVLASAPRPMEAQGTAGADSTKVALARRILSVTKSAELFVQTMEASIPSQKATTPDLPAAFFDTLIVRARAGADQFVGRLATVYVELFTEEELRQILAFHESPIGQRLIDRQSELTSKSMKLGQQWGMELGFAVMQDFVKSGLFNP